MRRTRSGVVTAAVLIAASALVTTLTAPSAAAATYFVQPTFVSALAAATLAPEKPAAGMNDFSCRPSAAHPYPVVLVNGTFTVMMDAFGALAPILANNGYCVFGLNYGGVPGTLIQAIGPGEISARQIADFVQKVKQATGVSKVDLVGYSQGGMLGEYYLKVLQGGPNVHSFVALGPTTHGTTLLGLAILAGFIPGAIAIMNAFCPACVDQVRGSKFLAPLDTGPIAQPGVHYTIMDTLLETVVTPVGSSFIREPGVTNLFVQSVCPNDIVDHVNLPYDRVTIQEVMNALDPAHPKRPNCLFAFPWPA